MENGFLDKSADGNFTLRRSPISLAIDGESVQTVTEMQGIWTEAAPPVSHLYHVRCGLKSVVRYVAEQMCCCVLVINFDLMAISYDENL